MLNLKKTAIAVLALGSSAVFAGTMGPVCTPGSVTVPCERSAWDFGVRALYLQTTGEDFVGSTVVGTSTRFNDFNDNWGWGFQLEGSYHFSTGNDVNVNWYHLGDSGHRNSNLNATLTADLPDVGVIRLEPKWDAVNFEFGQMVNFGEFKKIRFHGGAQYSRVERDFHLVGTQNGVLTGALINAQQKFDGFGPRVGADMSYDLANGFAIYGNGASALLIGDSKFNANSRSVAGVFSSANGSRNIIVNEFEGELGGKYNYAMPQGDLTLNAGYRWVNYVNVHGIPSATAAPTANTDFGIDGIIFGAKWVGNVM
jgi:hypothetical protein